MTVKEKDKPNVVADLNKSMNKNLIKVLVDKVLFEAIMQTNQQIYNELRHYLLYKINDNKKKIPRNSSQC